MFTGIVQAVGKIVRIDPLEIEAASFDWSDVGSWSAVRDLSPQDEAGNVGPFRADILCKDIENDHWVLIENQLERTDHSHLGQLLTYASGLEAVTIVWIAARFTEEHRLDARLAE